jgi:hypothetical protein
MGPNPVQRTSDQEAGVKPTGPLLEQLLNCVQEDVTIRRLAQIVSWTEGMAQQVREHGGPSGQKPTMEDTYFGSAVLLWQETLLRMRTDGVDNVQLDPDAGSRCVINLHTRAWSHGCHSNNVHLASAHCLSGVHFLVRHVNTLLRLVWGRGIHDVSQTGRQSSITATNIHKPEARGTTRQPKAQKGHRIEHMTHGMWPWSRVRGPARASLPPCRTTASDSRPCNCG